jgi:predicted alpha/beta-hydrolase family hydrolase
MSETSLEFSAPPDVRGYLHRPQNANGDAMVLSHGAGSNTQSPLLVALANEFASAGFVVLRCDLPYRQTRPHGPPGPGDAARDRQGLKNAVAAVRKIGSRRVFLGGHSYGGRQSTMLCAEEPDLVEGLLVLSYPLHPPRKPEQLRTQHLPNLRTPSLFVEGTRDPFGSIEEMEAAIRLIPARTQLLKIEGAGHDLGVKGKMGGGELAKEVLKAVLDFFNTVTPRRSA